MAISILITKNTQIKALQKFVHEASNANSELHGKRNQDNSYTLYTSKGGGSGASFVFKRSRADRQMNARAAILQVISNYKNPEDPEIRANFDSRFDKVQDSLVQKFNETSNEKIGPAEYEKPSERIDALRDYLIRGLPDDVKNDAAKHGAAHAHGRLYAKDVESKLLPELAMYLPE